MNYRQEIDGLRALAVLAVIVNHFDKDYLPSGHLGVDIFFVISGYVITSSLHASPGRSLGDSLINFYVKRIKRLLPALILCVTLSSILICLFNPNPGSSLKTGIFSLFGLSNLYLFSQATDYFGDSASLNVFTHTWSLGVEEQFYLFFPVLLWFTGYGRLAGHGTKRLVYSVGALSFLSLCGFVYLSHTNQPAAFFLMPTRLWELGAGCLLFVAIQHGSKQKLTGIGPLIFIMALVAALFTPGIYSVYSTVGVVLLTMMVIATLRPQTLGYQLLSQPAIVFVGRISYSLYLWHWVVLAISRWTIGISWWSIPLQAGLMLLLAAGSYRYVESPLRRAEWARFRYKTIPYGLAMSVASAVFLLILAKPLSARLYTGEPVKIMAGGVRSLMYPYTLPDGSSTWQGGKCIIGDNSQVGKVISIDECTLGNFENADKRVIVFGNSYSPSFVQAFDDLVMSNHFSVTITSSLGGAPVPEVTNDGKWNEASTYYWNEVAPSLMAKLRPGDWVFLVNDLAELSPKESTADSAERLKQLRAGLERMSAALARNGVSLAVMHGLPFMREANCEPALAARQWFSQVGGGPCRFLSRKETLLRRGALHQALTSGGLSGRVSVVDLMPVFCPDEVCRYERDDGLMLYRDVWSHPSVEAARLSAPVIQSSLTTRPAVEQ